MGNTHPSHPDKDPAAEPLLIDAATLARWLSTSKSTLYRRLQLGQIIQPHCHLGTQQPRWLADEARRWIEAGCPPQSEWKARRAARR
jgi:predicted DNA-binding transcriptional regulator AlpA